MGLTLGVAAAFLLLGLVCTPSTRVVIGLLFIGSLLLRSILAVAIAAGLFVTLAPQFVPPPGLPPLQDLPSLAQEGLECAPLPVLWLTGTVALTFVLLPMATLLDFARHTIRVSQRKAQADSPKKSETRSPEQVPVEALRCPTRELQAALQAMSEANRTAHKPGTTQRPLTDFL